MNLREAVSAVRGQLEQIDERLAALARERSELQNERIRLTAEVAEIEEFLQTRGPQ